MGRDKAHPFQMRVSADWLRKIDAWRRTQPDLPSRAEAIRRLVGMGLRFGIKVGDTVCTPDGRGTIKQIMSAVGRVTVVMENGDGHNLTLSEISTLNDQD